MANPNKNTPLKPKDKDKDNGKEPTFENTTATVSSLRLEKDLWYRIQILLYDLSKVTRDPQSEKRLSSTTHALYISGPYFSDEEAARIRAAIVDHAIKVEHGEDDSDDKEDVHVQDSSTVEEAIYARLQNFFEKRKASGDARPCGPHDMFPIYGSVFGISKEELNDERFLSRLRRSGLKDRVAVKQCEIGAGSGVHKKG